MTNVSHLKFPKEFHWGYATASAQIEGSVRRCVFSSMSLAVELSY